MTSKKRLVSRTRPFFVSGMNCADCLRMAGGFSARERGGWKQEKFRPGREKPCALLLAGINLLLEHSASGLNVPAQELVDEFIEMFEGHAARELGVHPDANGWVDCEKVSGIDWEDPEHETPPNKCVLLADKALRDLEMIMS